MIVTCPECQSRYHIDSESLGEARQVRCASCGNSWVQTPLPHTPQETSLAPIMESSSALPQSSLPSISRAMPVKLWLWGISLGVFLLFASLMVQNQQRLMGQLWTNMTYFYSLFKNHPPHAQEVFKITHLRTEVLMPHPSHKEIRLSGSITNTSSEVQALPPLKVHFWGENQNSSARSESVLLETRTHVLPQSHLLPGEILSFDLTLAAPHPHLAATSVAF